MRPPLVHVMVRRRLMCTLAAALGSGFSIWPSLPFRPSTAVAALGAAEMDLEFYLRNTLGMKPSPPVTASPLPPPRKLDPLFSSRALGAVESALAPSLSVTPSALREAAVARRRSLSLEFDRVLTQGAFGALDYSAMAPGGSVGGTTDALAVQQQQRQQYGFDLSLLCYFTLLADARLPRAESRACADRLGMRLLEALAPPTLETSPPAAPPPRLSNTLTGCRALLDGLQAAGYLRSYSLDDSEADDKLWSDRSDLSDTRLTITLTESASLRAAVVLNGRPGASPELARPLLTAYLRACGAEVAEAAEYFLDDTYRSNPLEYRANQQVLTLTIRPV